MASYARNWNRFLTEGASVVGISVDPVDNNFTMVDKLLLPFPLLSDPEGAVIRAFGVWNDDDGGVAKPSIFAVRKDGSLAWRYIGLDYADRPTDDELFESLQEVTDVGAR